MRHQGLFIHLFVISSELLSFPRIAQNDLPSYKQLFPSHLDLTHSNSEPLPSYDEYLQTLVNPSSSSLTTTDSPSRCLWITDRTRGPICARGTVTYV